MLGKEMRPLRAFVSLFLLAAVLVPAWSAGAAVPATAEPCDPRLVLDQMRAAIGGDKWSGVDEVSALGSATMAGLHGTARFDDDLARGRYARKFRIAVMGASAEIYDGATLWAQDISGGVRPVGSPYAREQAITGAYLARRGYFNRNDAATMTCLGPRVEKGRSETVIRVVPRGGSSANLAIDAQTHLLDSVAQRTPLAIEIVGYGDYRAFEGIVLPFQISSGTKSDPTGDYSVAVTRYELRRRVDAGNFARPLAPDDARMTGGATSTTVPMMLEGRQLMVWASIDGRPAMPFILDTGGHAILTTQAAKTLRLRTSGAGESGGSGAGTISTAYTRVKALRIGKAELLDQPFLVIPYPYSFYERGKRTPLAGIIGLEFFERYAARLDYGDREATFTPLSAYRRRGSGTAVPFTFESAPDMPMVEAAADGHPGLFGVDTGNAGTLVLFGDFLERTGLGAKYSTGTFVIGHGTGGSNTAYLATLREFSIGGHDLREVGAAFTHMKRGSFAAWTQAGNLGLSILSRFIPTFDYANRTLYLDAEHRATSLPPNRSGISFEKQGPDAFEIIVVKPGSAAARAGIVVGDRIVAVNGKGAAYYSAADLEDLVTRPSGTRVRLEVQHEKVERDVTIVLR